MGLIAKLRAYAGIFSRRDKAQPIQPVRALRKHFALMLGVNAMESAQFASGKVDARLKALAQIKTSALVGCPF